MARLSPDELRPNVLKSAWEILRKYDASLHSLAAAHTMTHQLVTKKFRSRHYDPVQLEGIDLKMVVVRGQKSMWPPGKREEWNAANNSGDLYKIRRFFPGWAPLPETQGERSACFQFGTKHNASFAKIFSDQRVAICVDLVAIPSTSIAS
ncbi:hypothetical protein R1sor_012043 [Riccia sorocarpa]|uniref:Uncharacterized protein n=1 Tax=Riccia sorocarpa TaxID=122646 RepID=A0ABD3I2N3_9MARC